MYNEKVKATWDQADQLLRSAQDEMLKTEDDVVLYLACTSARNSIKKFLMGYLMNHGVESKSTVSVEELLTQCQAINPKFSDLNINNMYCSNETHDANFCIYQEQVNKCIQLASEAKEMAVAKEHWPLSKPIK